MLGFRGLPSFHAFHYIWDSIHEEVLSAFKKGLSSLDKPLGNTLIYTQKCFF